METEDTSQINHDRVIDERPTAMTGAKRKYQEGAPLLHPQGPPYQQAQRIKKHRGPHHTTGPLAIVEGNPSGIRDEIQSYQDQLLRSSCGLQVPRTTEMSVRFQDMDQKYTTPRRPTPTSSRRSITIDVPADRTANLAVTTFMSNVSRQRGWLQKHMLTT